MSPRKVLVPSILALTLLVGGCGTSASTSASSQTAGSPISSSTGASTSQAAAGSSGDSSTTLGDASSASTAAAPAAAAGTQARSADAQCPTTNTTSFAKSKFVLHTGLAFGAFHRYLYKPYKAGSFTSGGFARKGVTIAKSGAAALFVKREIRLASQDVKANPTLCNKIGAPLSELGEKIGAIGDKLKHGDTSGIDDAQTSVGSIEHDSASNGAPIKEDDNPRIS